MAIALGERRIVSIPNGSKCPGAVGMTARTRSGANSANLPTREPVPEKPNRISLADPNSGWRELCANCVSAANRARPIPFDGSTFISPPVSDLDFYSYLNKTARRETEQEASDHVEE